MQEVLRPEGIRLYICGRRAHDIVTERRVLVKPSVTGDGVRFSSRQTVGSVSRGLSMSSALVVSG